MLQLSDDGGSGAIAVSIDGNGRRVACDPYTGAVEAVLECARNLACVGAEPLGLTNCLNFGNPEKPHIAWQLTRAVEGLRDACLALGVPVVGGNVSLYNEGAEGPIYPTPIVGMVGRLPDPERVPVAGFVEPGHAVALVGPFAPDLEGSELEKLHGRLAGGLPAVDLAVQAAGLAELRAAVRAGGLATVHDISEGGPRLRARRVLHRGRARRPRGPGRSGGRGRPDAPVRRGPGRRAGGRSGRAGRAPSGRGRGGRDRWRSPANSGLGGPRRGLAARSLRGAIPAAFA